MQNIDGTGLNQLTNGSSIDTAPTFSPDGSRILYVSDRSGFQELWEMNVDGTSPMHLTSFDEHLDDECGRDRCQSCGGGALWAVDPYAHVVCKWRADRICF
jgi:hypothetical protein